MATFKRPGTRTKHQPTTVSAGKSRMVDGEESFSLSIKEPNTEEDISKYYHLTLTKLEVEALIKLWSAPWLS